MNRLLTATLSLSTLLATPVFTLASSFEYSFDGVLSDHFEPAPFPGVAPLPQDPVGENLTFDNGATTSSDDTSGLLWLVEPSYSQSWTVSIDAVIPASYDNTFVDDPGAEDLAGLGIVAAHNFGQPGGATQYAMDATLEISEGGRFFLSLADEQDSQGGEATLGRNNLSTSAAEATLRLSFDSHTKTLSAFANDNEILTQDLDAPGTSWGMNESDRFEIGLFAFSVNEAVFENAPFTFDNFRASIVPEPASGLFVLTLVGMAMGRRRFA